jgi:hypothetical protein
MFLHWLRVINSQGKIMRNILYFILVAMVSGCSVLKPDYDHYHVNSNPERWTLTDLSNGGSETAILYLESGDVGNKRHIVLLHEFSVTRVNPPLSKENLIEGIQAARVPVGNHSIKIRWVGLNLGVVGGVLYSYPINIENVKFDAGKRYIVVANGWPHNPTFSVEDFDTNEVVPSNLRWSFGNRKIRGQ